MRGRLVLSFLPNIVQQNGGQRFIAITLRHLFSQTWICPRCWLSALELACLELGDEDLFLKYKRF